MIGNKLVLTIILESVDICVNDANMEKARLSVNNKNKIPKYLCLII